MTPLPLYITLDEARTRPTEKLRLCANGPMGKPCSACQAALDERDAMPPRSTLPVSGNPTEEDPCGT